MSKTRFSQPVIEGDEFEPAGKISISFLDTDFDRYRLELWAEPKVVSFGYAR